MVDTLNAAVFRTLRLPCRIPKNHWTFRHGSPILVALHRPHLLWDEGRGAIVAISFSWEASIVGLGGKWREVTVDGHRLVEVG
jgi:hypothetical protein